MIENWRFDSAFKGYDKKQVEEYLSKLAGDYDELEKKFEELTRQKAQMDAERDKIAKIFVRAQEQADAIVSDAEKDSVSRKKSIEAEIARNKAMLDTLKAEVAGFRNRINELVDGLEIAKNVPLNNSGSKAKSIDMDFEKIEEDFKIDEDFENI